MLSKLWMVSLRLARSANNLNSPLDIEILQVHPMCKVAWTLLVFVYKVTNRGITFAPP